jgi:hypothetical protein|tara:strand:- start:12 stop:506 length:495 start_codon:yes stop_codon:yes gene_type:complete
MNDPRLLALSERLNKYVGLIRAENPNMNEKDIVDKAATLALTEQKTFEAKMGMKVSDAVADRFGDGTMIDRAEDGTSIVRVDNIWQQGKGSKISEDGFHKKNHSTITMPKDIDVHTSEGNRKAGKFVEELKTAKKREDKMRQAAENQAWENRKIQVTVDKKENS